ncbi:MAG: hypothetical protein VB141_11175 [Burkholderia gladioli]
MGTTVSYRGYVARIEYDPRDDIFIGRVDQRESAFSFHGVTFSELMQSFQRAVKLAEHTDSVDGGRVPPQL